MNAVGIDVSIKPQDAQRKREKHDFLKQVKPCFAFCPDKPQKTQFFRE